jgi:hypothetical protein
LDRDLGRYDVARALRDAGARVEIHDEHFEMTAKDREWLAAIGGRQWILLTKDRHILTRAPEVIALLRANIHAFILIQPRSRELTGDAIGAAFVAALPHMLRLVKKIRAAAIGAGDAHWSGNGNRGIS